MTAPDRIWIDAWGGNWSPRSGGTQEIEYVRADLARTTPLAEAHPLAAEARMALEREDVAGWIGSLPKAPLAEALAVPTMTTAAQAMLDLHDGFLSGADVDTKAADRLHLAAAFGAQAFAVCPMPEARPGAMLRALLVALIDPLHPDLGYLRASNAIRAIGDGK